MKYNDFKQMNEIEMKNVKGGTSEFPPNPVFCTESWQCSGGATPHDRCCYNARCGACN